MTRTQQLPKTLFWSLLFMLVTALAPASASAALRFADPDSTISTNRWTAVPSATPQWDLLNDGVRFPAAPSSASDYLTRTQNSDEALATFTLTNPQLDPGETVTDATLWVYVSTSGSRELSVAVYDSAALLGYTTLPSGLTGSWFPVALTKPDSQAVIDDMRLAVHDSGGTGTSSVYAAYVELVTPDPPPVEPPPTDPPATDPPVEQPPVVDPPVEEPPVEEPPVLVPPQLERPLEVVGKNLEASPSGLVTVALRCAPTATVSCSGEMRLEEPVARKKSSLTAARRRKVVGKRRFKIAPGKSGNVNVRLDRRSFRKYKKLKKRRKLYLVTEQTDANGKVSKTTQSVNLSVK